MQYFKLFFVDYTRNLYFCVQNKYNITIKQGILMRFTLSSSALNARLQSLATAKMHYLFLIAASLK